MPIRLKQTTSSSDQFYPLNEQALSDGNKIGRNDPDSKSTRAKLTPFVKNVLKSTKNLAFDVVDSYIPNIKEVKGSFKQTIESAREDSKKEFGPLIEQAKSLIKGDGSSLKDRINKEKKEILSKLKQGKFYTSAEEEMEAAFGFSDDDFNFGSSDFSGSDSYSLISEPDSLSDEPFSGIRKGRVKSVNVSARNRQLKNKTTTIRPRKSSTGNISNQVRLGDELVSNTTSSVGISILKKQDEIWARNYQADKKNFEKLYGYQNQILNGVNALVEFNNNIMSQNVSAQMEFQGKLLAASQDTLASLKELKDAMIVVSSYKRSGPKEALGSKIASNSIGLEGSNYWKNIKSNISDVIASNPLLSTLMYMPMVGDMLSMSQDTGMKLINPLNIVSKGLFNMFLSKNTKSRMMGFNELLENFGGLFTGRMNMIGRYGANPLSQTIGKILGARSTTVSVIDMGLKDPDAVVGWTAKSDRTLNTVIPTLLAKQLAVMSGKDEIHYDYKNGRFKTIKSTQEEASIRREAAYQNAETVGFNTAIAKTGINGLNADERNQINGKAEDYTKLISKNLIKTGQMFDLELAGWNTNYRNSITTGIPEGHKGIALKLFAYAYSQMNNNERVRFNGAIRKVSQNLQQELNTINTDYATYGGDNAIVESGTASQLEELRRSIGGFNGSNIRSLLNSEDVRYRLTEKEIQDAANGNPSAHYIRVMQEAGRQAMDIYKLEKSVNSSSGPSAKVSGFGTITGGFEGGGIGSVPDGINKIFRLLVTGIPVYNQGRRLPSSVRQLRSTIHDKDIEAEERANAINANEAAFLRDQARLRGEAYENELRFKRMQKSLQANAFDYILPTGNATWQTNNALNRGMNTVINASEAMYSKLLGGTPEGAGIMGNLSYAELDRQNTINAINALSNLKQQLIGGIASDSNNVKDKAKLKLAKLLDASINANQKKLDIIMKGNDPAVSGPITSKINALGKEISAAYDDFSNKYIMEVRNPNSKFSSGNLSAAFGDVVSTIQSTASNIGSMTKEDNDLLVQFVREATDPNRTRPIKEIANETIKLSHGSKLVEAKIKEISNSETVKAIEARASKAAVQIKATASSTSEQMTEVEAKILNQMTEMANASSSKHIDHTTSITSVEEVFKNELNKHPALKKKWKQYSKTFQKSYDNAYNVGLMKGAEVYHQGKSAYESFSSGNIRGGFSHLGKTGSSIWDLIKSTTKAAMGPLKSLGANGLDYIDISTGARKFGGRVGMAAGGILGGLGLGPLGAILGGAGGRAIGRGIGGIFDKRYPVIRGALLERGHIDAPTMNEKDLYALVLSMKGIVGSQLRAHPEFKELESRVYRNIFRAVGRGLAKVGGGIKRTVQTGSMLIHGTLPYRHLISVLDQTINGNKPKWAYKEDVYSYDKYMLYASIKAMSERTKDERTAKAALTSTKDFRKLERSVQSGKGMIASAVEDLALNAKRKLNRLRHFKYRYFIDFLKANGNESIEYEKDPAMIYAAVTSWGRQRKNRKVFNVIRRSKAYIELEKAVSARGENTENLDMDAIRRHSSGIAGRNRKKYAVLIGILKSNGIDVDESNVSDIHVGVSGLLEKMDPVTANGIRRSKVWKKLCAETGNETGASSTRPIKDSFFSRIRRLFGNRSQAYGSFDDTVNREAYASALKSNARKVWLFGGTNNFAKINASFQSTFTAERESAKTRKRKIKQEASEKVFKRVLKTTGDATTATLAAMQVTLSNISHRTDEMTDAVETGGKGNGKGFFSNLASTLGKGGIAAGLASLAGIGMLAAGGVSRLKNAFGNKGALAGQGFAARAGYLTGINSDFVDESKWFNLERGANGVKVAGARMMGGLGKMFSNVKHLGTGIKKAAAMTFGPAELIKDSMTKIINNPKIVKRLGPNIFRKITSIPGIIAKRVKDFTTGGAVKSFQNAFKAVPVLGWVFAAAEAVAAFAGGMNNAPRYFNISPKDCTAGMRTASAVASMLKSILQSILSITGVGTALAIGIDVIVPMDWLVQTCYKLVASAADEAELKIKQKEESDRAKALGTDAETLSKAENHSLLSKMGSGIHAAFSSKTYAEIEKAKTAKRLGMTPAEYDRLNSEYESSVSGDFKDKYPEFAKLTSPADAVRAFADPNLAPLLEAEAETMFRSGDLKAIHRVYKAINNKKLGRHNRSFDTLNPSFRGKVQRFLSDPTVSGLNLSVNEAQRNPFTQFAYYSKGRASDEVADTVLALAGFGGLKYWGGDNSINTKTLRSKHLGGHAIDFRLSHLSSEQIAAAGEAAKKYGITWGGSWADLPDAPHFEDSAPQLLATGGIVNRVRTKLMAPRNFLLDTGDKIHTRLNAGEMVLTKPQQIALFNKLKRYEYDEMRGTSARNPVRLNESPLVSNDRDTINLLNEALEIQNKIYQEQTRHNKVSEEFYVALMKLIAIIAGGGRKYDEQLTSITKALTGGSMDIASGF